jgi:hypothetical protein
MTDSKTKVTEIIEGKGLSMPQSSIERARALDPTFDRSVEEAENNAIAKIDAILDRASSLLMSKLAQGEKLEVQEVATILDSVRKWKSDVVNQRAIREGRPTSITGHLHAGLCPRWRKIAAMSDEEL